METAPSRKALSRERILDAAARAIRRQGCDGVGVADVMKEAGLTHGGFYAHFPSRDALLVEALAHAGRDSSARMDARVMRGLAQGQSPLRALVTSYLTEEHAAHPENGCAVAALAAEVPRQVPEVRQAGHDRVTALVERVRQTLPPDADPQQALVIAATLVGALQLARALGDGPQAKALLQSTRDSLLASFDASPSH